MKYKTFLFFIVSIVLVSCSNSESSKGLLSGISENWKVQYDIREATAEESRGLTLEYIGEDERSSTNIHYTIRGETAYESSWGKSGEVELNSTTNVASVKSTLGCKYPCDGLNTSKGIKTTVEWEGKSEELTLIESK